MRERGARAARHDRLEREALAAVRAQGAQRESESLLLGHARHHPAGNVVHRRPRTAPRLEHRGRVVALADPLDRFTQAAIAAATGRRVVPEVAVPVELEAALDRLYPDLAEAPPGGEVGVPEGAAPGVRDGPG